MGEPADPRIVVMGDVWIVGLDGYEPGDPLDVRRLPEREHRDPPPISAVLERLQEIP